MKEQVKGLVYDLKSAGWTTQKIEKELNFSNGSLGKVINGKAGLSDFRYSKLLEFHKEKTGKTPTITEGLKKEIEKNNLPENKAKILKKREIILNTPPLAPTGQLLDIENCHHPLWKEEDPKEGSIAFFLKYDCNSYQELEQLKTK